MTAASPALSVARPAAAPRSIARLAYRYAARAYVVAVAAQVALAGVFVFVGPQTIELHKTFAHTFLLLSAVLLSSLVGPPAPPAQKMRTDEDFVRAKPTLGDAIPELTVYDSAGKEVKTSSLRGHYTVLTFGCLT